MHVNLKVKNSYVKKNTSNILKKQVKPKETHSILLCRWSFQGVNDFWLSATYLQNMNNIYNTVSLYFWQDHLSISPCIPIHFFLFSFTCKAIHLA